MAIVSLVMVFASSLFVAVAFIPCLGCLNWLAIPMAAMTTAIGLAGLFTGRDPRRASGSAVGAHAMAAVIGALLTLIAVLRCAAGGGMV